MVRGSFNDVNEAQQERSQLENEAKREYNKVIELARGDAKRQVSEAEGYQADRVNRAEGDVARFRELVTQYQAAKDVTRRRLGRPSPVRGRAAGEHRGRPGPARPRRRAKCVHRR